MAAILGPTIAPIGAVSAVAIGGLASQLGFAVLGAGTAVLAFQGVGDALKALNKYELEPTEKNLMEARLQLEQLSPAAAGFAQELIALKPRVKELQELAATGLFPGLSEGLDGLESAMPRVEKIVSAISTEVGEIAGDAGQSLGSDRWAPFLDFLAEEGPSALSDFAAATGNTAHALAGLWMATDPANDLFSQWLVESTADLDRWAQGVGQTQGFADFLAYVEKTGPQVGETLGALANATLQIVEASAPLGGPVLSGLEAAADVISAIADSDLGTPIFIGVGALALLNRGLATMEALAGSALGRVIAQQRLANGGFTTMGERLRNINVTATGLGKTAALVGGVALASTGAADSIGLTNTASLALVGTIGGPWGVALGAGIGLVVDATHANDQFEDSINGVNLALKQGDFAGAATRIAGMKAELEDFRKIDGTGDFLKSSLRTLGSVIDNPANLFKRGPFGQMEDDIAAAEAKAAAAAQTFAEVRAEMDLRAAGDFAAEGLTATAAGLDTATQSATDFASSIARANDLLSGRAAVVDYEAAIDDFTESLKKNGQTLDVNTEKGRNNRTALDNIAGTALRVAESISDPRMRAKFLDNARSEFIKAQKAAGVSAKAARQLADDVGLLNQVKGRPKIDSGSIDAAIGKTRTLKQLLSSMGPVGQGLSSFVPDFTPGTSADGSTVPKTGRPYADRHLYLLADGEEVVSNRRGQADRYRPLLKAINNAADGATVGSLRDYVRSDLDMKAPSTLKQWNAALHESTKVVTKDKDARQALLDQAEGVRSSIMSGYRSDIFASDSGSNVWASQADRAKAGKGDIFSALTGDNNNIKALIAAEKKLARMGLDEEAFADLVSNASLDQVLAFANGPASDVQKYEDRYNQREKLLVTAGNVGASAAFGPQLAASKAQYAEARKMNAALARVERLLDRNPKATGAEIARAIRGAAPKRGRR